MIRILCLCAALSMLSRAAAAVEIQIPILADTSLSEATPANNLGGHTHVLAGTDGGGKGRRGLVMFDVAAALPAGAIVEAASLRVAVNASNPHLATFSLHRMLVPWNEGVGATSAGQPAQPGEVTWNNRVHPATPWGAPGGAAGVDYAALPSSFTAVDAAGQYVFNDLAADVQSMLDAPAANFGWLLISDLEGTPVTGRQFESQDLAGGFSPILEVSYSLVPEPGAATLALTAAAAIIAARWHRKAKTRARSANSPSGRRCGAP